MNKKSIKLIKTIMSINLIIIGILLVAITWYLRQDKFGKSPSGARLERIKQSPNYRRGQFQNLSPTPTPAPGHNWMSVLYDTYIKRNARKYPTRNISIGKN